MLVQQSVPVVVARSVCARTSRTAEQTCASEGVAMEAIEQCGAKRISTRRTMAFLCALITKHRTNNVYRPMKIRRLWRDGQIGSSRPTETEIPR